MECAYDLGLLVFPLLMGAAAMYGLLKGPEDKWHSFLGEFDMAMANWLYTQKKNKDELLHKFHHFLKAFNDYAYDPYSSCIPHTHDTTSDCKDAQFSSWEERIISAKKRERKVGFYLKKKGSDKSVLAVVGRQSINASHMSYEVYESFVRNYAPPPHRQPLKWNTKREMIDWLLTLIVQPNIQVREEVQFNKEGSNSFFKVLIGDFHDHLNVPSTYLEKYDNIKNGSMRLRNGEREWIVEIDGRVIKDGWNNFVKAHKLREGDFLLFSALGEMFFNVAIFGANGRIKEFPWFHVFNPDGRAVYL